jgi:hypothetical protein
VKDMGIKDYALRHGTEKVVNTVEKRLKLRAYSGINCYDGHLPGCKLINNETEYQLFSGHGPWVGGRRRYCKGQAAAEKYHSHALFHFLGSSY